MPDCCDTPRGSECHCAACHQTFTGLGLFDAHQHVDYTRQPAVTCEPAVRLGLVQDGRGTWGTPEGVKARQRSATALAIANQRNALAAAQTPLTETT
jgi:hypothetical protein